MSDQANVLTIERLSFVLPADSLPAEDCAAPELTSVPGVSPLFSALSRLVSRPLMTIRVAADSLEVTTDAGAVLERTTFFAAGRRLLIEAPGAFCSWTSAGMSTRHEGRSFNSDTRNQSLLSKTIERLVNDVAASSRFSDFTDERNWFAATQVVPVLRWSNGNEVNSGELLGFWLRNVSDLEMLAHDEPQLASCSFVGISEAPKAGEVEGRFLREALASALVFGFASLPFAASVSKAGTDGPVGLAKSSAQPKKQTKIKRQEKTRSGNARSSPMQQEPAKVNSEVLAKAEPGNIRVVVNISKQRMYLMVRDEVAIDSPISSGRTGKATPTGNFTVSEKDERHISSIYNCPMKYFLRLSGMSFGLHVGELPGYPASHGCVRLPEEVARTLFEQTPVGTNVTIEA
jgi:lipoprotein-anchoring transpeptidase ErfK/SrfK